MKTNSLSCVLVAAGLIALAASCGKKEDAAAPKGASASAAQKAPDVPAWTLANAFLKDLENAKSEYEGKEFVVRNLLAYLADGSTRVVSSCAFDPQTKTVSTQIVCRYQGQDLVSGEEFNFDVEFADPAEFETIKDPSSTTVADKAVTVFETLYAVQGTLRHEGVDNGLSVKNAKLLK